jgi:hypothetical protein
METDPAEPHVLPQHTVMKIFDSVIKLCFLQLRAIVESKGPD